MNLPGAEEDNAGPMASSFLMPAATIEITEVLKVVLYKKPPNGKGETSECTIDVRKQVDSAVMQNMQGFYWIQMFDIEARVLPMLRLLSRQEQLLRECHNNPNRPTCCSRYDKSATEEANAAACRVDGKDDGADIANLETLCEDRYSSKVDTQDCIAIWDPSLLSAHDAATHWDEALSRNYDMMQTIADMNLNKVDFPDARCEWQFNGTLCAMTDLAPKALVYGARDFDGKLLDQEQAYNQYNVRIDQL